MPKPTWCWPAWLALAASIQEPAATKKAVIGELVPDYEFRKLTGGDGRRKLSELRGQPVFIVNWTDTDFGRGASGQAEKVAKELVPQGLVCILLDTHNKTQEEIEAAVMRLYPGNLSWLARNHKPPIAYLDNGPPPDVALIGVDGRLLVAGSYTADFGKARELAEKEVARLETGWGEHKAVRKARAAAFGRQRLAEAKALLGQALAAEPEQPELLAAQAELETLHRCWVSSVSFLADKGELLRSFERAKALAAAVAGEAEWEQGAAQLLAGFEAPEVKSELELDRKLADQLKPLDKRKPGKAEVDKLSAFAQSCGENRVGRRARRIAEIAARTL